MLGMTKFGTISQGIMLPPLLVDYLVVAGGGAGGFSVGGGGGGGGFLASESVEYITNTAYAVTVGAGGVAPTAQITGNSGGHSTFNIFKADGGGGGGAGSVGAAGGSGGGGGGSGVFTGGATIYPPTQGHNGANSVGGYLNGGGAGGGGAGSVGASNSDMAGGNGGEGKVSSITGTSVGYAGGGGGGGRASGSSAGGLATDGGGKGAGTNGASVAGTPNTGGGGGGGTNDGLGGKSGGSGVVILRFPKAYTLTVSAGLTYTDTELDGDKIYTFTAGTGTVEFKGPKKKFKGWLTGWLYGKSITIPANKVDAELTNFPLTVYLNDVNFDFSKAEADGKDIRFTDVDGEDLIFERKEHIAGTTKSAVYNVKIPTVSNTEDTKIYMWYGNASATDTANTTGDVWDDNYVMVQHMGDSLVDATGQFTSTNYGSTVVSTDYGKARSFANTNAISAKKMSQDFTAIIFCKQTSTSTYEPQLITDWSGPARNYLWGMSTSPHKMQLYFGNGASLSGTQLKSPTAIALNTDYALALTRNGVIGEMFIDGVSDVSANLSYTSNATSNASNVFADEVRSSGYSFIGIGYAVRLSNIARSDAWIKAESLALKNELITQADL